MQVCPVMRTYLNLTLNNVDGGGGCCGVEERAVEEDQEQEQESEQHHYNIQDNKMFI